MRSSVFKIFLSSLSAVFSKFGSELVVLCGSYNYHRGISARVFLEQMSLGGFLILCFHCAKVKILHKLVVFLLDVINNDIFPETTSDLNKSQFMLV